MDVLKAEIAKKRKQLEEKELLGTEKKYFKRGELIAKEQEEYRQKYGRSISDDSEKLSNIPEGDKSADVSGHSVLPRQEVISRLRDRAEPILLFGETEADAFKRLRKCELLEPEVNKGFRNDFQEAMEQVDQAFLDELLHTSEAKNHTKVDKNPAEAEIGYEGICEMAKKMGKGDRDHDMTVITYFILVSLIYSSRECLKSDATIKNIQYVPGSTLQEEKLFYY